MSPMPAPGAGDRRRRSAYRLGRPLAVFRRAAGLCLTATVPVPWAGVFAAVRNPPTLQVVGVTVIGAGVLLAFARTVLLLNEARGEAVAVGVRRPGRGRTRFAHHRRK